MNIRYYEQALTELLGEIDYYFEIDVALAEHFNSDIQDAVTVLMDNPEIGKKHHKYTHLRILNCKKFPYSLIISL